MSYSLPYSFIPGTKARAQELNANFSSVVQTIDDFDAQKADIDLSNLSQSGIDVLKNNSVTRNIGEVVMSALPLEDAGLHLLDGSTLDGNGVYKAFVDYIKLLYNNNNTYNDNAFTKYGNLTITSDGIASGFTNTGTYIRNNIVIPANSTYTIKGEFTLNNNTSISIPMGVNSANNELLLSLRYDNNNNRILLVYKNATGTPTNKEIGMTNNSTQLNTSYIYEININNSNIEFIINGETIGAKNDFDNIATSSITIGRDRSGGSPLYGTIDLKETQITLEGETILSGLKSLNFFTDETTWQNCVSSYGECAKFVYDSTNNTVRLPKISGIIEGTFNALAVGNLTEAGLPDISGYLTDMNSNPEITSGGAFSHEYTNSFNMTAGSGNHYIETIRFSAHSANPLYGSSSTVQPQTVKYLVYIVVATTPKTDIQIDINNIATDLNNKVDTDLTNCTKPYITETYKNGSSWYRIYSDGWCEQGGIVSVAQNSTGTTVTLLKSYLDTNYTRLVCLNNFAASWNAELCPRIVANSTSQIGIQSGATTNPSLMSWYTCGKIR